MKLNIFNSKIKHRIANVELPDEQTLEQPPVQSSSTQPTSPTAGTTNDATIHGVAPVIRTYMYKSDIASPKRYFLFVALVTGAFIWWLGPLLGLFIIDPLLTLMFVESQVITPATQCFDSRLANQTCDSDVMVDYYLYNITNPDEWIAGLTPPSYQQVGPFSFKAKEIRYNLQYSNNWTEVEYTYHQYAEFLPESSCPECTMNASITSVNRAYLQFLSAPTQGPISVESQVIYGLMPITLSVIRDSMIAALYQANPSSKTLAQDALNQWTDCSFLLPLMPILNLTSPYLKSIPLPPGVIGFPFNPELCAYIPGAVKAATGLTVTPADFASYGLDINKTSAATFLQLAIGNSNATHLDPLAAQYLGAFLTQPQATTIALVAAFNPAAAASLSAITAMQWQLMQGYTASLVPTWGTLVYSQWLSSSGGGMIINKNVSAWLWGFEDPLLLTAAQQGAATAGNTDAYKLTPWTYTPFIGLTFAHATDPIDYFSNVTGQQYNYSMLTWNSSDIGHFHPLIQQKKMKTGKAPGSMAQEMLQYRGVPYFNKTWGILNVTGVGEGVAFGMDVNTDIEQLTWDSVLSVPIMARFTGFKSQVKEVTTLIYNMTDQSTAACNMTYYGDWALNTSFDPVMYNKVVNNISPASYWSLIRNDTALTNYVELSQLHNNLGRYFGQVDVYRDRCAIPNAFQGMWDMSATLACPTIQTFPHFLGASPKIINTTGVDATSWKADPLQHGYVLGVEPSTGYALQGHKTYQINHLVTATPNLYPQLWVAPGSANGTSMSSDFVTVPTYWARMWWQPTDSAAMLVRILNSMQNALYYILVLSFPVIGWASLGTSFCILRFGKDGKERRKALPAIQKSRARPLHLTGHEMTMTAGLRRIKRGSIGVVLPQSVPQGLSEISESDEVDVEHGEGSGKKKTSSRQSMFPLPSSNHESGTDGDDEMRTAWNALESDELVLVRKQELTQRNNSTRTKIVPVDLVTIYEDTKTTTLKLNSNLRQVSPSELGPDSTPPAPPSPSSDTTTAYTRPTIEETNPSSPLKTNTPINPVNDNTTSNVITTKNKWTTVVDDGSLVKTSPSSF